MPKTNLEIAISLSGGGFRAAMFHLGTLDYLQHIHFKDGTSVLDNINAISTISGGSLTGLWYMQHYCKGTDLQKAFADLYQLLENSDIPTIALSHLLKSEQDDVSLINSMVKVYDELFFHKETFCLFQDHIDSGHIHHFSANATDFYHGVPFRFQASRLIKNAKPEFNRGFIGNYYLQIPWEIAGNLKLSEIMAASSCFPGAFEPIRFPYDFSFGDNEASKSFYQQCMPINLMDGGIVDNQGVDSILRASEQMTYDNKDAKGNIKFPSFDLIIISDVSSPKIDETTMFPISSSSKMSIRKILKHILVLSVLCVAIDVLFWYLNYKLLCLFFAGMIVLGVSLLFVVFVNVILLYIKIRKKTESILKNCSLRNLWNISFGNMIQLFGARANSLLTLAQSVFMKPIRQMRYQSLYESECWRNRLITNNVSELSSHGRWTKKENLLDFLKPVYGMMSNSDKASSFNTTLWFTDEDRKAGIPKALFKAGQYTICWNLLEYVEKIKKDETNVTTTGLQMLDLEDQLRNDWENFKTGYV